MSEERSVGEQSLPLLVGSAGILLLGWVVNAALAGRGLGPLKIAGILTGLALTGVAVGLTGSRGAGWRAKWLNALRERDTSWADVAPLALVSAQVGALALVMRAYRIESPAFYEQLVPLFSIGFVVHHFVPKKLRMSAFLSLSLAAILVVFGMRSTLWLIALGASLVAICHLPIRFGVRVLLLAVAGVILALCRAGTWSPPWPGALWPVLGSMFMFRLIAYMYDLRHQRDPVSWPRTLSYFFLLPNVAFPLFPVVDFNTFKRTYYDRPALQIYQQGVEWMVRGVTHLLLYRAIYQYATLSPADVVDTPSLVRYLLANFGLYLRVSGQFHLVVGILHLFGFRLPETHRFFYLASSFTDFWRRINIYWKDFMMKVVFYPVHARVKHLGESAAVIIGTLAVFTVTWLTHSYQWYWLLGTWLFSATDAMFWGILAAVLVVNSVRELRLGRTRSLGKPTLDRRAAIRLALRTAGTFAAVCVLWSLWTAPTLRDWWAMMSVVTVRPIDFAAILAPLTVVGLLAVVATRPPAHSSRGPWRTFALTALPLCVAWVSDAPTLARHLSMPVRTIVRDVRTAELNRRDAQELQRGYYERLVGVNRFNGQLWEVFSQKAAEWPNLAEVGALAERKDILSVELKPMLGLMFHGSTFRTNADGMRDRDYTKENDAGARRFAVLGASYVMGDGVNDDETFENLVEDSLNASTVDASPRRFEFLNFAVSQYDALAHLTLLENGRVFGYSPDVVLVIAHRTDLFIKDRLARAAKLGRPIPDPFLLDIVQKAGIDPSMTTGETRRRLAPFDEALIDWTYRRIVATCRARGVVPVWVYIPTPEDKITTEEHALLQRKAVEAGYTIIDLSDVYRGQDEHSLIVADWDKHPNVQGHRLIAQRLLKELRARPELITGQGAPVHSGHM